MGNKATRDTTGVKLPQEEGNTDIHALPEGLHLTHDLSHISSRCLCVCVCFKGVQSCCRTPTLSGEDFLPPDYCDMLSSQKLTDFSSKKELFLYLCSNPILVGGGTKTVNLEKTTGKKCVTLGAKTLGITWRGTPQYWKWRAHSGSRFAEVSELIDVCQLEMTGRIHSLMLSKKTTYGVYLVVNHGDEAYKVKEPPIDVWATFVGEGGYGSGFHTDYLENDYGQRYCRHIVTPSERLKMDASPSKGGYGWMEIEMGVFYNDEGEDGELQIFIQKHSAWERALIVEGIQFRPKISYSTT